MLRPLPAVLLSVALLLSGCGRERGPAPKRILEREESVGAARVRLKSELAPSRGTLGDPILWRLTATMSDSLRAAGIHVDSAPPGLETDTTHTLSRPDVREIHLRGFDLGAIPLPRATLDVTSPLGIETIEFPRDTLFVDSLTAQATGQLRPDRGPIATPLRPVDIAILIAAGVLVVALLLFLILAVLRARRRKEEAPQVAAPDPPEAILERELEKLESELAALPRDLFYERLAQILRRYAAASTGVDAMDLTTSELDRALARRESVRAEGRELLIGTLRRSDLAKFGRYRDEEAEARSIVRQARSVGGAL